MDYPKSVLIGTDNEVLDLLIPLHYPLENPYILDCTYNKGVMWKKCKYSPSVKMDIDPDLEVDVVADFTAMPFGAETFDIIVFDPPHLPNVVGEHSLFKEKYNTRKFDKHREKNNVIGVFVPFLKEAKRVLKKDGIILAKIADLVHNHRYQWQQVDFVNSVRSLGITPCDMLIKLDPKAGNLKSSKWKNIKHLRKSHCYWIVCRNSNKCESK